MTHNVFSQVYVLQSTLYPWMGCFEGLDRQMPLLYSLTSHQGISIHYLTGGQDSTDMNKRIVTLTRLFS